MPYTARIGDQIQGYCNIHETNVSGQIITGSSTVIINNAGVARLGDLALGSCGHTTVIVEASPDVYADGIKVARLGDAVDGNITGTIVTGSSNVITNG